MIKQPPSPFMRLWVLAMGTLRPPPGKQRIILAFVYGITCHCVFAVAVISMIAAMYFGMSQSMGRVPAPWSIGANLFLVLQFPIVHSVLLTLRGSPVLKRLAPRAHAQTLSSTTFAIIASAQLFALFVFWTPSGFVWWRAEGFIYWGLCFAYGTSWLLLMKASYDAGAEVQSGALGWMSLAANKKPVYPDMPENGLFRFIRQPIYLSFALTTWTVPIWTPDQLVLAITLTAYCLIAPIFKERRFAQRYGERFAAYKARIPYMVPRL